MTSHATDETAEHRSTNEAVVGEVLARISGGRYDDMLDLMHEDLVFELPYGPKGMPPSFDKAGFSALQSTTFKMFDRFSLELVALFPLVDPDALVAEYRSDAIVAATGAAYKNHYIGFFRFRDGKVVGWREFHNPEATKVVTAG